MKLRNKKTGKVIELDYITVSETVITIYTVFPDTNEYCYASLDKICKDWEDYKPKEPLIKDEKIRKAVRTWAEANGIEKVWLEYSAPRLAFRDEHYNSGGKCVAISFQTTDKYPMVDRPNSIDELCGEEE